MIVLLHLHRKYAEIMEEAGYLADFEKLMDALDDIHEARDLIDGMVKAWEAYTILEIIRRRARKHVPPTILSNLIADTADIIEATTTPP